MKKRNLLTLFLVIFVVAMTQFSCKPIAYYLQMVYKVHGTVTDTVTGYPLESVEVFISTYQYSDLTNGLGDYELEMASGTWDVEFVKEGYETQIFQVTCSEEDKRVELNVALMPEGVTPPPAGENIIYGDISLDQSLIDAGINPFISQSAPLIISAMAGDEGDILTTGVFPPDEMEYTFPYSYILDFPGDQQLHMAMSLFDADGNFAVTSGDLAGFVWDPGYLPMDGSLQIDIVLTDVVADGTITGGLSTYPPDSIGLPVYFTIVDPYTGSPEDPLTWLGAGTFVISDDPGEVNAAIAREIDPDTMTFGEIMVFPGGLYSIYLFIDYEGDGPPPSDTDPGFVWGNHMLFGDAELWGDIE